MLGTGQSAAGPIACSEVVCGSTACRQRSLRRWIAESLGVYGTTCSVASWTETATACSFVLSQPLRTGGDTTMAAGLGVDHEYRDEAQERLDAARPDLLRDGQDVRRGPHGRRGGDAVQRGLPRADAGAVECPQRLADAAVGHLRRHDRTRRPEAAVRLLLPGLAARAPSPGRGGADQRRRDQLPARCFHPADGQARRDTGIASSSRSQVSRMAAELGGQVEAPPPNSRTPARTRSSEPTRSPSRSARADG